MFHRHKWSDWAITERGKVMDSICKENILGSYITQERYCPKCGKVQLKTQKQLCDLMLF